MSDVRTVRIKFSNLVFLEDNPRTIKRENLLRLAERIRQDPAFFDARPCLVNFAGGKYVCYAGFQRAHAAAKILKWKEVPCSVENDLPEKMVRTRAITDNTHDGEWDTDVLANWEFEATELQEMAVPEWVFGGGESGEPTDYSQKNKEIDVSAFSETMEMKFRFEKDDFMDVQERLNVVCAKQSVETKEAALLELLKFYERHG